MMPGSITPLKLKLYCLHDPPPLVRLHVMPAKLSEATFSNLLNECERF